MNKEKETKTESRPKKEKRGRRGGSKKNYYFGDPEQKAIEVYIDNLTGTPRTPLENEMLDDRFLYGFFTTASSLNGEFTGSVSGSVVGYVDDTYYSGSVDWTPVKSYINCETFGPGKNQTHLSGTFSGCYNGSFESYVCRQIYESGIKKAFETLVNSLIHTYKINFYGEDVYHIASDAVSFLYETIHKYNPSNGAKAFAYFNMCAKHWLIGKSSKLRKRKGRNTDISEPLNQSNINEWDKPEYVRNPEDLHEESEFLPLLLKNVDSWLEIERLHPDEKKLLKAIKQLFDKSGEIEVINKKSVYMFLRDLCDFDRNQLSKRLKSIRNKYKDLREEYNRGNI